MFLYILQKIFNLDFSYNIFYIKLCGRAHCIQTCLFFFTNINIPLQQLRKAIKIYFDYTHKLTLVCNFYFSHLTTQKSNFQFQIHNVQKVTHEFMNYIFSKNFRESFNTNIIFYLKSFRNYSGTKINS